jgi:hypothetical protein
MREYLSLGLYLAGGLLLVAGTIVAIIDKAGVR